MGSAVLGDSYRIYLASLRDGIDYHLAYIPEDFNEKSSEPFDKEYMRKLFKLGFEQGKQGYQWHTSPPGYETVKKDNTVGHPNNNTPVKKRF